MRLVFISSVTAMTPLRTISVTTGSGLRTFAGLRTDVLFFAIASTHVLSRLSQRCRLLRHPPLEGEGRERSERGGVRFLSLRVHPTPTAFALLGGRPSPSRGG